MGRFSGLLLPYYWTSSVPYGTFLWPTIALLLDQERPVQDGSLASCCLTTRPVCLTSRPVRSRTERFSGLLLHYTGSVTSCTGRFSGLLVPYYCTDNAPYGTVLLLTIARPERIVCLASYGLTTGPVPSRTGRFSGLLLPSYWTSKVLAYYCLTTVPVTSRMGRFSDLLFHSYWTSNVPYGKFLWLTVAY